MNRLRMWRRGGEIIDWMKRERIDAIINAGFNDLASLRVMTWASRRMPVLMLNDSNVHRDSAAGLKLAVKKAYIGWILSKLTALMPNGTNGVKYYQRYPGGAGKPTFFLPCDANYDAIASVTDEDIRRCREKHGLREDRRYLVFCGRFDPVKRIDLLVDAFASIAADRPDWDLILAGDGELMSEITSRIPDDLRHRFVLTGFLDGAKEVTAVYRCAEALVLASAFEAWAAVIPESMATGCAIVSSHVVGATADLIEEDVNGYTFRSGDGADLAEKLLRITDDANIDRLRRGSADVLRRWRERSDPVDGVRRALEFSGLLAPASGVKPTGDPYEDWKPDVQEGVNALAQRERRGVERGPA
ncbi:MAG: hypothetical protein CMJ31_02985 [Phycisphaerae bacterium]|nr:hypothetical protein [Phycisphaerae bacterium]